MEGRLSASLGLPAPNQNHHTQSSNDFHNLFTHFITPNPQTTLTPTQNHIPFFASTTTNTTSSTPNWASITRPSTRPTTQILLKNLTVFERALIGAGGGGIAGAFTYFCLHPLDTIKTKLQTKGASDIYANTFDAVLKTFQTKGISGFYSGISAVIVGSTASSAVYFGTCELGKSVLSKLPNYPPVLIPPTAGAMGNIVSSAIMVPKELITQRMQAGAKGRSWQVLLKILENDGFLGLYAGYSATLLRNLPAGVLSYSSFEYLKSAVLSKTKQTNLEPIQSVVCGALAGAISASITTPLDVVKTRLMTGAAQGGVSGTVKQILMEEGWVGFTRGVGPRVLHSACFSALGYFAFETARLAILNQYIKRKELQQMQDFGINIFILPQNKTMCKLSSPQHNPTMDILKTESGIDMNVRSSPLADEEVKGKVSPASPFLHCFRSKNTIKYLKHISRDHFAMALSRASVAPTSSAHPWKYDKNQGWASLSANYDSSAWCLDELSKILERMEARNASLPIFYDVVPSNPRDAAYLLLDPGGSLCQECQGLALVMNAPNLLATMNAHNQLATMNAQIQFAVMDAQNQFAVMNAPSFALNIHTFALHLLLV
ncbi:hypothetical protein ACFX2I_002516 [Malus domestica]